jgi:ferredoxin-NADP reductase
MAGTAVRGRLTWQTATVGRVTRETASAVTLLLEVADWAGPGAGQHRAGQHVDIRLTADDGYQAERAYSIASAPGEPLAITVERLDDGEVSPYLTGTLQPGYPFELRGPIGGWFAWPGDDPRPLLLLAGGSGIVPLMSMIRTHSQFRAPVPIRLIYSARTPADVIYQEELSQQQRVSPLTITYLYTRSGWAARGITPARDAQSYTTRLNAKILAETAFPPTAYPATFVCGPSGFVEAASSLLVAAGHAPGAIKTERFGPGG